MTLWHSKEIEVCIQITKNGVTIYGDVECTALVDYDVIDGDLEWEVTGFQFGDRKGRVIIDKDDQFLFNQLKSGIDDSQIDEVFSEELSHSYDDDSGLCNRSRLTA